MDILFTAFALLCLSACALCVYACIRHASEAFEAVTDLRGMRARLVGLDAALTEIDGRFEKLTIRLKRLEGRFYAERSAVVAQARDPLTIDAFSRVNDAEAAAACDNWQAAQLEGPRSKAAECQCAYCLAQRAARAAEKARILAERRPSKPVNGGE